MKTKQILDTGIYTDGRGNVREILGRGKPRHGQQDYDVVRFKVIAKLRGPLTLGSVHTCTRKNFGLWAEARLT